MLPSRPPTSPNPASTGRRSGPIAFPQTSYDAVKKRVLGKLEDRLDMSASKRMPQSLLRQSLRQHAEHIVEQEARGFAKADRDRLIDEVLSEVLGYGPVEELFADPSVREIMVTGPGTVIARREQGQWLPTSVKFRDESHVRATLDRIASHADTVGQVMTSVATFDMKLPNGFRVLAVIPPEALGQPATVAFVRETPIPGIAPKDVGSAFPGLPSTASTSNGTLKTIPNSVTASPRATGSGLVSTPPPRTSPIEQTPPGAHDPLARYRARLLERLLTKFASLGLYDVRRLDVNELRRIISAYITEYMEAEKIYLSDSDQGRLTLEILTSLRK